jgi:Xaa-Pro dipeptidase
VTVVELPELYCLPEPERGFLQSEFESRLQRAQKCMEDAGLSCLLLTTEPEIRYFTGFLTQFWQSPTRPWFLVVPLAGKPVAVIPGIGAACMERTWLDDIRCWSSPHPDDDGVGLLAETISELAGKAPVIGVPMGRESYIRMPFADFQRLNHMLPQAKFENVTPLINRLRSIKSAAEITKIRHAVDIASAAFANIADIVETGMTEREIFRVFKIACLQLGADDPVYLVGGSGQGGYGDIISPPSGRKVGDGDILILDIGLTWDGYYCDFDRNFAFGQIHHSVSEAHRIAWDATEAGLEAVRPGITCADLFAVMQSVMAPHQIDSVGDVGRLGHGLGMQLTEFPSLTSWDQTVLEPGMLLTLEPGYTFADSRVMVHEENCVVRENGVELLSRRTPREIPLID